MHNAAIPLCCPLPSFHMYPASFLHGSEWQPPSTSPACFRTICGVIAQQDISSTVPPLVAPPILLFSKPIVTSSTVGRWGCWGLLVPTCLVYCLSGHIQDQDLRNMERKLRHRGGSAFPAGRRAEGSVVSSVLPQHKANSFGLVGRIPSYLPPPSLLWSHLRTSEVCV